MRDCKILEVKWEKWNCKWEGWWEEESQISWRENNGELERFPKLIPLTDPNPLKSCSRAPVLLFENHCCLLFLTAWMLAGYRRMVDYPLSVLLRIVFSLSGEKSNNTTLLLRRCTIKAKQEQQKDQNKRPELCYTKVGLLYQDVRESHGKLMVEGRSTCKLQCFSVWYKWFFQLRWMWILSLLLHILKDLVTSSLNPSSEFECC